MKDYPNDDLRLYLTYFSIFSIVTNCGMLGWLPGILITRIGILHLNTFVPCSNELLYCICFLMYILNALLRGIPFISKLKRERFDAIGHELQKGNYDIVSLQEVLHTNVYTKFSFYNFIKTQSSLEKPR